MGVSVLASGIAAKKALENLVDDMYNLAKSGLGKQLKRWKTSGKIDSLYKKLRNVRLVKTILQPEKAVDLVSFYYPSKIKTEGPPKEISDLSDFAVDGGIVIQGTVGQGKSTFLRYLASQELLKGDSIPVFFELRRVRVGQKLLPCLLQELKSLGLDMDRATFEFFADNGKLILFLDAFDEVKEEQRVDLIAEIESLAKTHEKLRIAISSRPNSGISTSPFFRVFEMAPLEAHECNEVIKRVSHDSNTAACIIEGIRREKSNVAELLTTPLMVALLVVRYRIEQTIPENAVSFYESLFALLLQRHDKSKGGYVRPRKSGLGDTALEEVFNAISFTTRKVGTNAFTMQELCAHGKEALRIVGQKSDIEKVLADIIDVTCLILTEGDDCRFVHKSVQEFHAAMFIKEQPDGSALRFYQAVYLKWLHWVHELEFLLSIDKYRSLKEFHIPQLQSILGVTGPCPRQWESSLDDVLRVFGADRRGFGPNDISGSLMYLSGMQWPIQRTMAGPGQAKYSKLLFAIKRGTLANLKMRHESTGQREEDIITLKEIVDAGLYKEEILAAGRAWLLELHEELLDAEAFVKHIEETKSVFDF